MSQFYIFLPTWDVYHVPSFLLNARNRAVTTRDKNRSPTEFHSNKLLDLFLLALILGIISCLNILPQFSSVAQSCLTLCDPMDCSMPGLPVHHQLPEFTQTHVHWASDENKTADKPANNLHWFAFYINLLNAVLGLSDSNHALSRKLPEGPHFHLLSVYRILTYWY